MLSAKLLTWIFNQTTTALRALNYQDFLKNRAHGPNNPPRLAGLLNRLVNLVKVWQNDMMIYVLCKFLRF